MINNKYGFFLLIGIVSLLCGCGNEDNSQTVVPLRVRDLCLNAETLTRAGGTPVTTPGATIKTFLTSQGGYAPHHKTYTYASGKWDSLDPICVDKRVGRVLGVYDPYNLVGFPQNSPLTNNQVKIQPYAENQLWYYDNETNSSLSCTNSTVAFSMKCVYARLAFSLFRNPSYPSACKVSRIMIKPSVGQFYTTAQVNIESSALVGTPASSYTIDTSSLSINTSGISAGATDTSIDYLFPGQSLIDVSAGLILTFTIDGLDYSAQLSVASSSLILRGVKYLVQIEITGIGNAISISGVDVTNWIPSDLVVTPEFK